MEITLGHEVRPGQLAAELSEKLGQPVTLAVRQPTEDEEGVVVLRDADGADLELKGAEARSMRKLVDEHESEERERKKTRDDELLEALQSSDSLEELKAALVARFSRQERPARRER